MRFACIVVAPRVDDILQGKGQGCVDDMMIDRVILERHCTVTVPSL